MLSLLHTSCKRNNKLQENAKISNRHYHIQGIKDVQRINSKMTWKYQKFPRHPVAAKKFKMRGINTIISHYHYRVDPEFAYSHCDSQLDKYWGQTIPP